MKSMTKMLPVLVAAVGIGGGLYLLRAQPVVVAAAPLAPAPAGIAAATPIAAPASAVTPPAAAADTVPEIPALASDEERQRTETMRRETLPVYLQVSDRTIAQLEDEIALLQRRGAPQGEIQARQDRIRALQATREKLLARNADIVAPH